MQLGVIGTGNIASALVRGLCTSQRPPRRVLVSPRNAEKAAALAKAFTQVEVAPSNRAVVDGGDTVVLAVLPQDASAILEPLVFRMDQRVISPLALTPLERVRSLVAPADRVVRVLPLPSCVRGIGPIVIYPEDQAAIDLFGLVGIPIAAADERELNVLWALTALIAPYFTLIAEAAGWAANAGVTPRTAGAYVAGMFHALSALATEIRDGKFATLLDEAATPGGLNEQALHEIRAAGGYEAFLGALDSILARLGKPVPAR